MDRVPGFTCACGGSLYLTEGGQLVGCRRCGVYARASDAGGMRSVQNHNRPPQLVAVPTPPRWAVVTTVTVAAAAVLATGALMAAGVLLPQGRL